MGLEPTILPLGGARLIHLATRAAQWEFALSDCHPPAHQAAPWPSG